MQEDKKSDLSADSDSDIDLDNFKSEDLESGFRKVTDEEFEASIRQQIDGPVPGVISTAHYMTKHNERIKRQVDSVLNVMKQVRDGRP